MVLGIKSKIILNHQQLVCCPDFIVTTTSTTQKPTTADPKDFVPLKSNPTALKKHKNYKLLNDESCGISNEIRIIGGEDASLGGYPWM